MSIDGNNQGMGRSVSEALPKTLTTIPIEIPMDEIRYLVLALLRREVYTVVSYANVFLLRLNSMGIVVDHDISFKSIFSENENDVRGIGVSTEMNVHIANINLEMFMGFRGRVERLRSWGFNINKTTEKLLREIVKRMSKPIDTTDASNLYTSQIIKYYSDMVRSQVHRYLVAVVRYGNVVVDRLRNHRIDISYSNSIEDLSDGGYKVRMMYRVSDFDLDYVIANWGELRKIALGRQARDREAREVLKQMLSQIEKEQ